MPQSYLALRATVYLQNKLANFIFFCNTFIAVNLREDPNQPFNPHPEIGKYFKGFNGTRYIPNECVRQQYPDDVETED